MTRFSTSGAPIDAPFFRSPSADTPLPPDTPRDEKRKGGREWLQTFISKFGPTKEKSSNVTVLDFEKPLVELDSRIIEVSLSGRHGASSAGEALSGAVSTHFRGQDRESMAQIHGGGAGAPCSARRGPPPLTNALGAASA